jgi:ATPase domain predominantly from Archaea
MADNAASGRANDDCKDLGLLRGIDDVTTARYYSADLKMDSVEDVKWLKEVGLPYQAAIKDAAQQDITVDEYLEKVEAAVTTFIKSGKVHDREEFYEFLEGAVNTTTGKFCLILGGKSVGKSLVLADFAKKLQNDELDNDKKCMLLLLDARSSPQSSLANLILKKYQALFNTETKEGLKRVFNMFASALGVKSDVLESADVDFRRLLGLLENITANDALESFVKYAESMSKFPILIVDEANLVLGRDNGIDAISKTLSTIVQLTKQSNRLTVILASSEYGYPYKLVGEKDEQRFNLADISSMLFAGEIPPSSMWDLLVTTIGMGENLASLLIASYGGHFLRLSKAVDRLKAEKELFSVADALDQISAGIVACFKTHPTRTLSLLRQLAKVGFVLVSDFKDPAVEMIVKMNLGGLVSREMSKIVGLPGSVWSDAKKETYCLVPASESARLVMARFVLYEEEERLARRWWRRLLFWRKKI